MITWKLIALVNIVCNIDRTGVLSHHYFHITTQEFIRPPSDAAHKDVKRTDLLSFNRVEGRWNYVSFDTRVPAGLMPAWISACGDGATIKLTFAPFAITGPGTEVTGQLLRMEEVIMYQDEDHDVKDQYFTVADGTGTKWLAHRYAYARRVRQVGAARGDDRRPVFPASLLVGASAFVPSAHGQARRVERIDYVVKDARRSAQFYEKALGFARESEVEAADPATARIEGLKVVGGLLNQGPEQERLDGAPGALVRITPVRAAEDAGPGVEFIQYLSPSDGRNLPSDSRPNDLWAARIELAVGIRFVSPGVVPLPGRASGKAMTVLDPDGHRVLLLQR